MNLTAISAYSATALRFGNAEPVDLTPKQDVATQIKEAIAGLGKKQMVLIGPDASKLAPLFKFSGGDDASYKLEKTIDAPGLDGYVAIGRVKDPSFETRYQVATTLPAGRLQVDGKANEKDQQLAYRTGQKLVMGTGADTITVA